MVLYTSKCNYIHEKYKGGNIMFNEAGILSSGAWGVWVIINGLIAIAGIVLGIICVVLFIKLATRGIKALDISIKKNKKNIN